MDFGAVVGGYHSDMTRTIAVGSASDEMRLVYDTVLKAQLAACAFAKAGQKVERFARFHFRKAEGSLSHGFVDES